MLRDKISKKKYQNLDTLTAEALNEVRIALLEIYSTEKRIAFMQGGKEPILGSIRSLEGVIDEACKRGWEPTDTHEAALGRIRVKTKAKGKGYYEDCLLIYEDLHAFFKNCGGKL